jgi:hypothetical protein
METFTHSSFVHGVGVGDEGLQEPITVKLTPAEQQDDAQAPIWIVEIWEVRDRTGDTGRWKTAQDFRKHGVTVPVLLEKAISIARTRQQMRADFVYRVRNIQSNASIMAAVL